MPRWPGVWNAYMLGTADFPQVALSVCKHARRFIIPAIFNSDGFQRMDAYAVADYCLAHRWLSWLGAQCEAPLANWGKNGETFLSFVWLREFAKSPERTAEASISEQS